MPRIRTLVDAAAEAVSALLALGLAAMVAMVFGNVVLRYAFNSGITVSEELSRWLFVWLTFLGAVLAVRERAHLGSDVVVSRLGPAGRKACRVVGLVAMVGVDALLLQGSFVQARINLDVEAPASGWSMAVVYGAGVVFAVLAGLVHLLQLGGEFAAAAGDADAGDGGAPPAERPE